MRPRKMVVGVALLSLPILANLVPIGVESAGATTTGTGVVDCFGEAGVATGSIKYSPAWSDATIGPVTAKIKFKVTGACTGGSPAPTQIKGSGTVTFTPGVGQCSEAEETGAKGTLKLTYGQGIAPSKFHGFIAPDPGPSFPYLWSEFGGNKVTGSFPNSQAVPPFSDPEIVIGESSQNGNCSDGVTSVVLGATGGDAEVANI